MNLHGKAIPGGAIVAGASWRGAGVFALGTGLACALISGGVPLAGRLPLPTGVYAAPLAETIFTAVIFIPMALIAILLARLDGDWAMRLGDHAARRAGAGLAIGCAGFAAAVGDARLAGTLLPGQAASTGAALLAWGALVILVQSGSEEIFFRGWLQRALQRRWGAMPAVLAAAVAFTVAHLAGGARAPLSLVNLLLGGMVFGLLAQRAGGLAPAIAAHAGWNAAEQLGFGLDPNPGVGSFGAVSDHDLAGGTIWGGSAEGLNASAAMTFALVAILLPLLLSRIGSIRATDAPAPYRSGSAR